LLSMFESGRSRRGGSLVQLLILRTLYLSPMHGYKLLGEVNELMAGRRRIYKLSKEGVEMLKDGRKRVEEQKRALDEMIAFYNEHFMEN